MLDTVLKAKFCSLWQQLNLAHTCYGSVSAFYAMCIHACVLCVCAAVCVCVYVDMMHACVCLPVSHIFGTNPHANTPESHHARSLHSVLRRGIYGTGVTDWGWVILCDSSIEGGGSLLYWRVANQSELARTILGGGKNWEKL